MTSLLVPVLINTEAWKQENTDLTIINGTWRLTTSSRLSESEESEGSVSISCRSSPFEQEDGDEERSSAFSDDEEDEVAGAVGGLNINPYQFEPYASNSSSEEEDENANENRLQYTTW